MADFDEVLDFWFGERDAETDEMPARFDLWFGKSDELDATIRERFQDKIEAAAKGELDHWTADPHGRLALIICIDQFRRNVYRHLPETFAFDDKAIALAEEAIADGLDLDMSVFERMFYYLPFMHSEEMQMQMQSLACFEQLAIDAPEELRASAEYVLSFAVKHRDIVSDWGRFPHRNEILGRKSTPEEIEFLKQADSSF